VAIFSIKNTIIDLIYLPRILHPKISRKIYFYPCIFCLTMLACTCILCLLDIALTQMLCGGFGMSKKEISKAAKTLSKLGSSKGGSARAAKMTSEQRSAVGSRGADARWGIPQAEHIGDIHIGDMHFPCSVLSDGTRILTQSDFMEGMGMNYSGWV